MRDVHRQFASAVNLSTSVCFSCRDAGVSWRVAVERYKQIVGTFPERERMSMVGKAQGTGYHIYVESKPARYVTAHLYMPTTIVPVPATLELW